MNLGIASLACRHNPIRGLALDTAIRNHVKGAADNLTAPGEITPAMISAGASKYKAMCEHCYGGIDVSRAEWAKTMRPIPPALAHAAQGWSIEEVHWLVQHGVKMSGMPAFGPTHDEATIWSIAAFVKAMPEISATQYAGYSAAQGSADAGHSHATGTPAHED